MEGRIISIENKIDKLTDLFTAFSIQVVTKFEQIDKRFDKIDQRLDKIEAKLNQHDNRFDEMDANFERNNKRFNSLELKLNDTNQIVHHILDFIQTEVATKIDLQQSESRLQKQIDTLNLRVDSQKGRLLKQSH